MRSTTLFNLVVKILAISLYRVEQQAIDLNSLTIVGAETLGTSVRVVQLISFRSCPFSKNCSIAVITFAPIVSQYAFKKLSWEAIYAWSFVIW